MYEVQPTTVRAGHWRLAIGLVALIAVTTFGVAFATRSAAVIPEKALSLESPLLASVVLPAQLDCHDLSPDTCAVATRAAMSLFSPSDGRVRAAGAWKSLLCSNTMECSPRQLTPDSTPVGSVILTFAIGPAAWINVVSRPDPTPAGVAGEQPFAWLVRWR